MGRVPHNGQWVKRLTQYGNAEGRMIVCSFAHKGASTQFERLLWLRHRCAYVGRLMIIINSQTLIEIGRHARYSSSTPPHPERERHSHMGVKTRVDIDGGTAVRKQRRNLEGLKTGKMAVEQAAMSQPFKTQEIATRGGHKLSTNRSRTRSGAVGSLAKAV